MVLSTHLGYFSYVDYQQLTIGSQENNKPRQHELAQQEEIQQQQEEEETKTIEENDVANDVKKPELHIERETKLSTCLQAVAKGNLVGNPVSGKENTKQ